MFKLLSSCCAASNKLNTTAAATHCISLPRQTYSWLRQPKFGALTCPSQWIPKTQLIKPVAAILKLSLSSLFYFFMIFALHLLFFCVCSDVAAGNRAKASGRANYIILLFFFFCINLISAAYYQHELAAISQRLRQSAKQTIEVGWSSLARRHLPEECDSRIIILMISRGL